MGAFASLSIPLDLSRPGGGELALDAAGSSSGAIDAGVTPEGLTLKLQMPGNIGALMGRLRANGFATPDRIGVSVPVRSLAIPEKNPSAEHLVGVLNASGDVFDAQITGDSVTAFTGPTSKGLYRIYHALIHEGLIAQDTPTLVALRGL